MQMTTATTMTLAALAGLATADTGVFYPIDPTTTFQRTCEDAAGQPLVIDLDAEGYSPGDTIRIRAVGDFAFVPGDPEDGNRAIAVFSSDGVVLADRSLTNRVPGAIQSDAPAIVTGPPNRCPDETTDIPEDFECLGDEITVPDRGDGRAAFLVVSPLDEYYSDNEDGSANFGVEVDRAIFVNQKDVLDFDSVSSLADYAPLGVTFSSEIEFWSPAGSCTVLDDPSCGPYSAPRGICAGPCGGVAGWIFFDPPISAVSIVALSGPGPDLLNQGTFMRVFGAGQSPITELEADWMFQFDVLEFAAEGNGIRAIEISSSAFNNEAWDHLIITRTIGVGCNLADLTESFGVLDLSDINVFTAGFVAMDPIADLNTDGLYDLGDINLFVESFTSGCP